MPSVLTQPVPHQEAAKFIADKLVVSRQVFDQLLPDLRPRAFVITGLEDANLVQSLRDRIAEIPQGADWGEVKKEIVEKISPWIGHEEGRAEKRAELLLRTHGNQAYSAAQHGVMDRQRAAFPWWQYLTADDDRVRDSHAALDGLVLPADSPFWATHFPPWDFGCRCQVVPLSEDDVADIQAADADKKPEEHRVLDADRLREIENSGMLTRAMPGEGGLPRRINVARVEREGAYSFNPGTLKMDAAQLSQRYDPEVWAQFERFARNARLDDGRTVLEWLAAGFRRAHEPAPAIDSSAATNLVLAPSTAENTRQAIRETTFTGRRDLSSGVNETILLINGRKVVFKAAEGEHPSPLRPGIEPGTQYRREVAASVLDEELKLGLVPPTTLLVHEGREGSAQLFLEKFKPGDALRNLTAVLARLSDRLRQDWQLFDELAGNLDRHAGNYLLRSLPRKVELALIDHGLAFSTQPVKPAWRRGLLLGQPVDDTNLQRLAALLAREDQVRARLAPLLEPRAIDLLFTRARSLLKRKIYAGKD